MIWFSSSEQRDRDMPGTGYDAKWASDPLGQVRELGRQDPFFVAIIYVLASLFLVICLSVHSEMSDLLTIHIVNYSHISAPVLVVGFAILPARFLWLAYATFAVSFICVEMIAMLWTGTSAWSALGMVQGLVVTLIVGTLGGGAARWALRASKTERSSRAPEQAALLGAIVFAISGALIGGVATWIEVQSVPTERVFDLQTMLFVQAQREAHLAIIAAGGIMMVMLVPMRTALPEILAGMLVFAASGVLFAQGYSLFGDMDPVMIALALLILRPIQSSLVAILGGFSLYIALTGRFVDLPTVMSAAEFRDDFLTNILFGLMVMLCVQRVHSSRIEAAQRQALGRMSQAQELARFGYFLYDFKKQSAYFDPLSQKILEVPALLSADEFLWRVHPDDRDAVSIGATTREPDGLAFSFRFALKGPWTEGCAFRRFTGFARYEKTGHKIHLTYGLIMDVTREHSQEEHLRFVLAELSEKQGQQTQIFSMISHELRTPASILSMIADELDEGKSWPEKGPQMRAVLDQLLAILSDMRQTVRPEQNLPVRIESFRAQDLAESVKAVFDPMADARGICILLRMGPGAAEIRGTDRLRLNQTLSNLVKNAIVHSQATEIVISYEEMPGPVGKWRISDNGRNIPLIGRETIFHPFVRGDGSGARVDGSGLGLYIAKEAIELLGGQLEYVETPLSGAEFQITLPLMTEVEAAADGPLSVMAVPEGPSIDLSGYRVLVVEDSETMGDLLVARLRRVFGDVVWMRDGPSGLSWALEHQPDVVITDLFMPGLGGDELVLTLRKKGFTIPIIGMTATDIGEEVDRFRTSGANEVFTKPINVKRLEQLLAPLL